MYISTKTFLLLLFVACFSLVSSAVIRPVNHIKNSGYEKGELEPWYWSSAPDGNATVVKNGAGSESTPFGKHFLSISVFRGYPAVFTQQVPLRVDRNYTLSVHLNTFEWNSDGSTDVTIEYGGVQVALFTLYIPTNGWQQYDGTFQPTVSSGNFTWTYGISGASVVLGVDRWSLTKI